ncbi:CapA family protein [Lonepinella koalarum]|uniref:Poly-gamma-glutamate synthesis protein (Capsule biosynthesis protein) n=1 Tax=Lonepinella koalarum TaxID=53417 RepID=A0A4V2PUV4_9PAST|nr:CapA family protein [Lonepinella koalarum]MDH2926009.1 capsule biosynthesis protein CapA [Lonepinella koalarum]TCK71161.1 poly-gamma-glutamate synthesis protein (capsule biosynthesis protein) [Lonepinella koalarum]TFJ90888.1 CapA family protein [Lonepinella koalarum]
MRFIVCGDALFSSRNLAKRLEPKLIKLLKEADGCFVNAEFCTPKYDTPPAAGRGYITSVQAQTLDEFVDLNLLMVGFVNNHTGDYGWQGVVDTIESAVERKLIPCGVGRSLGEARLAKFLDTIDGRVGIVAAGSTRSEVFAASDAGAGVVARPGSNPLRWKRTYVLESPLFDELEKIDRVLGTRISMDDGLKVETYAPQGKDNFKFGSLFEGALDIERGVISGVKTSVHEKDAEEILKSIQDASKRADLTIFSLHTHEGVNENWYSPYVPEFIEDIAHRAIDNGANVVVMHGAHFLRGIEVYKNSPIFYNLGSIFMEFEAGESIITPEMYESYGFSPNSRPSELHTRRAKDIHGNFIGFNAERRFSENCLLQLDFENGQLTWSLLPIDLQLNASRTLDRGIPKTVSHTIGHEIAQNLTKYSLHYNTKLVYDENDGYIHPVFDNNNPPV